MSIEFNKKLVSDFIQALLDKRVKDAMELVHMDCQYMVMGNKKYFSFAGIYNKQQLEEIMAGSMDVASGDAENETIGVTAEGNRVALETRSRIPTEDGGIYEQTYHFLFEIKDKQISVIKEYLDTLTAHETFKSIADKQVYKEGKDMTGSQIHEPH